MNIEFYPSLADKEKHFEMNNIESKDDLDKCIFYWRENKQNLIFRGVSDAKYKLFNSAQRYWIGEELDKLGKTYSEFIQNEIDNAKLFQNGLLTKFYDAFGHRAYDLSILSFLQHYGAPTPLLDFTYNPDCALFFGVDTLVHQASNDINNYFSIYAIDKRQQQFASLVTHLETSIKQIDNLLNEYENDNTKIDTEEVLNNIESLNYRYLEDLKLFYLPGYNSKARVFQINKRPTFKLVYNQHNLNVINQQGLFVFFSDPNHPLEDYFTGNLKNFNQIFNLSPIKCWNIHKSLNEYVKKYLAEISPIPINREFIYPQEEFIAQKAFVQYKNLS